MVRREVLHQARPGLGLHLLIRAGIGDFVPVGLPCREAQETQGASEDVVRLRKKRFALDNEHLLAEK